MPVDLQLFHLDQILKQGMPFTHTSRGFAQFRPQTLRRALPCSWAAMDHSKMLFQQF
jgi:hypothetical protein